MSDPTDQDTLAESREGAMKAYSVTTSFLPGSEQGICCHKTAAKAKAFCAGELSDVYNISFGDALRTLRVVRAPAFDEWAAQQSYHRIVDAKYAKVRKERAA